METPLGIMNKSQLCAWVQSLPKLTRANIRSIEYDSFAFSRGGDVVEHELTGFQTINLDVQGRLTQ